MQARFYIKQKKRKFGFMFFLQHIFTNFLFINIFYKMAVHFLQV